MSSLLELFSGRFDSSEVEFLLGHYGGDKRVVANYLLTSKRNEQFSSSVVPECMRLE